VQTLLVGVRGHERFELSDQHGVTPKRELRVDPLDLGLQLELAQPAAFVPGGTLEAEVCERRSVPKRQRLTA
jgi:hypothetical protein